MESLNQTMRTRIIYLNNKAKRSLDARAEIQICNGRHRFDLLGSLPNSLQLLTGLIDINLT